MQKTQKPSLTIQAARSDRLKMAIIEICEAKKMTQEEVADKCDLPRESLSRMMNNSRNVSGELVLALAKHFFVDPDWLYWYPTQSGSMFLPNKTRNRERNWQRYTKEQLISMVRMGYLAFKHPDLMKKLGKAPELIGLCDKIIGALFSDDPGKLGRELEIVRSFPRDKLV